MAEVTESQLRKEIKDILKGADLSKLSAKKVRQQLEEKLGCDLMPRKKEVDNLVMEYVNSTEDSGGSAGENDESDKGSDEESEPEEPEVEKKAKRTSAARKSPVKRKKHESSDEESGSGENASDDEYVPQKKVTKKSSAKKGGNSSDSDEDWKKTKKTKKAAGKKKGTGFTRAYTLSPELASLMGADSLPRHEVVKKMWAMIKERNLYDPKNKQYAICDNDLMKVIGVKRFRTFGMLKYLRPHFID